MSSSEPDRRQQGPTLEVGRDGALTLVIHQSELRRGLGRLVRRSMEGDGADLAPDPAHVRALLEGRRALAAGQAASDRGSGLDEGVHPAAVLDGGGGGPVRAAAAAGVAVVRTAGGQGERREGGQGNGGGSGLLHGGTLGALRPVGEHPDARIFRLFHDRDLGDMSSHRRVAACAPLSARGPGGGPGVGGVGRGRHVSEILRPEPVGDPPADDDERLAAVVARVRRQDELGVRVHRLEHSAQRLRHGVQLRVAGVQHHYLVPLEGAFTTTTMTGAGGSVLCEVYVPHDAPAHAHIPHC